MLLGHQRYGVVATAYLDIERKLVVDRCVAIQQTPPEPGCLVFCVYAATPRKVLQNSNISDGY